MRPSSDKTAYSNKFYNIKILKIYVAYLKEQYGWSVDRVEKLLELCGRDITILDADDQWFDQDLADLFHEKIKKMTGDEDIAYKVGKSTFSSYAQGIQGKLFQGLLSPQLIFKNLGKYSMAYSRGAALQAIMVTSKTAVVRSTPVEGCIEKAYQCRNRKGMLEAIAPFLGCHQIRSAEHRCFHRGDDYCEYSITWENRAKIPEVVAAMLMSALTALTLLIATHSPILSALAGLNLGLVVYFFLNHQSNQRLQNIIRDKDSALQESLRLFNRRYEENTLRQNILFDSFHANSLDDLSRNLAKTIRGVMKYDRVMILLVDHEKNVLQMRATAGFEGDLKEMVETAEFHIDPKNTHGFFIRVLNKQEPLFLGDAPRKMDQLSPRSQKFLELLGTTAFIAVPIITSGHAAGVIAVENTRESRPLVNDDMDLLVEVAKFMGFIIPNIKNFQAIQKSEKLAKALEEQERQLRTIFQKFVPEEAVSRLSHFGSEFLSVQKRVVDVMFVDIIGFTTISEKFPPEEVADILNIYIDEIQRTVNRYKGRINKIIGDGLLIYFDNLGPHSILAGYAILQACVVINSRLAAKGYPSLSIGVGAHRGVCTLGLIGTKERLDYTLIGDTVNVAARIENYTRQTGPNTFCFSSTLLPEAKKFRHISKGKVFLKGRKKSIGIFQLLKP